MVPTINNKATGLNLKLIMQERGIAAKDIQRYLGLSSVQGIYHWLSGRNIPSIDNLYALSSLFNLPIDEIICGNRDKLTYSKDNAYRRRMVQYYLRTTKYCKNCVKCT